MASLMMLPMMLPTAAVCLAVVTVVAVIVYTIAMVGYVRPAWSHHSMDVEGCARGNARRIVRRAGEVRQCMEEFPDHPIVHTLIRAYPSLPKFAKARGPGEHAPGGDTPESELEDAVYEGVMGITDGVALLQLSSDLAAGPSVYSVLSPFADQMVPSHENACPVIIQRAACAISDVRMMASMVVRPLRTIQEDRTRKMELPETVLFHLRPEVAAYTTRMKNALTLSNEAKKASETSTRNFIDSLDVTAEQVMFGESREGFAKLFKLAGMLFKMVGPMVSVSVKILMVFLNSIDDIVMLLFTAMRAVAYIVKALSKGGIIGALVAIIRVAFGMVLKVLVTLMRIIPIGLISKVFAYVFPLLTAVFLTLVFVLILAVQLILAIADYASNGTVRCLSRADQDPDAWWKVPSYERGNIFSRNVLVWRPCMNGFVVSDSSVFCQRIPIGIPTRSPAALLARLYINGSFGELGRKVPRRDAVSLEQYSRLCQLDYKNFLNKEPYANDLVMTLCMCRYSVLGGGSLVEELAHYASGVDPVDARVRSSNTYMGVTLLLVSAAVAMGGFAARSLVTRTRLA